MSNTATLKFCSKKNAIVDADGKKRIFITYYAIEVRKNGEYYDNITRKDDPTKVVSYTVHPTNNFKAQFAAMKFPFVATLSPNDKDDRGNTMWFITTDKDKDGIVRKYKDGTNIKTIIVSGFAHTQPITFRPVEFED